MEEEVEIEGNVNTTMHPQASSKAPNKEFQSQLISTLFPQANHKPRLGRSESLLYWLLQDHPEDEEIPYFCRGKDRKALFRLIVCLWAEPIVGTGPFDREWTKLVREREMKRWADVEKEDDVGAVTILVLMSLMGAGIGMSFTRVEIAPKKQIGRGAANVSPLAAAGHGPGDCCSSPYPISPSPKGGVPSFPSPPSRGPKQSICPMCKKSGDISTDCPCALSLLQGLGVFAPTIPESVLRLGNASPSTKSGHSRHERVARGTRSHRNPCARNENDSTVDFTDNSQSFYTPPSIIRCSKSDISTRKSVSFVSFEDNEEQDIATEPDLSSSTDLSITSAVSKINKWQIENGISGIRKRAIKKTVRISANEYRYSPTFIPWPDTPKPAIGSPEVVMGSGDTSQYVSCQGQPLLEFGTPEEAGTVDCTPPLVPLDLGKAGARAVPVPVDVGQVLAAASLQLCTSKKQRVTKRSGGSGKRMARRSSSSLRFSDEWSEK
ncbi:hypothetical protein DFH27DRAFT_539484 [Peziza echinospora]|nr:hypothetical protein DFH27DRAFT_539484 [Peziza echinospora]